MPREMQVLLIEVPLKNLSQEGRSNIYAIDVDSVSPGPRSTRSKTNTDITQKLPRPGSCSANLT